MSKRKTKSGAWFIKLRGSYIPCSWQGWLLYIPFVAYLMGAMAYAWDSTESPFRTIFALTTQFLLAAIIMTWIATKKSK